MTLGRIIYKSKNAANNEMTWSVRSAHALSSFAMLKQSMTRYISKCMWEHEPMVGGLSAFLSPCFSRFLAPQHTHRHARQAFEVIWVLEIRHKTEALDIVQVKYEENSSWFVSPLWHKRTHRPRLHILFSCRWSSSHSEWANINPHSHSLSLSPIVELLALFLYALVILSIAGVSCSLGWCVVGFSVFLMWKFNFSPRFEEKHHCLLSKFSFVYLFSFYSRGFSLYPYAPTQLSNENSSPRLTISFDSWDLFTF